MGGANNEGGVEFTVVNGDTELTDEAVEYWADAMYAAYLEWLNA
jgi:hypothetical protein